MGGDDVTHEVPSQYIPEPQDVEGAGTDATLFVPSQYWPDAQDVEGEGVGDEVEPGIWQ